MAKAPLKSVQRLDKCIAHLFAVSRQVATRMIKDGEVSVDGKIILEPSCKINLQAQIVINNNEQEVLNAQDAFKKRLFILNKPYNYVCADKDNNYSVVLSLFTQELNYQDLHCAGRLDVDTTGLVVVTDDGDLNHAITSPKKLVNKVYFARLDKAVSKNSIKTFKRGIKHPKENKPYQSALLTLLPENILADDFNESNPPQGALDRSTCAIVQITEGRYHEVKRLFEVVSCNVVELVRLAIGGISLDQDLNLGQYKPLNQKQIEKLLSKHEYSYQELVALVRNYKMHIKNSSPAFLPTSYLGQNSTSNLSKVMLDESLSTTNTNNNNFDDLDSEGNLRIF